MGAYQQQHPVSTTPMLTKFLLASLCVTLAAASPIPDEIVPETELVEGRRRRRKNLACAGLKDCDEYFKDMKDAAKKGCCCDGKTGFADTCGKNPPPPPPAAKKCTCKVDTGRSNDQPTLSVTGSYKTGKGTTWDWAKDHKGHFRSIKCTDCQLVTIVDDDKAGSRDDKYLGSTSNSNKGGASCCSTTCSFDQKAFWDDLNDDVRDITLNGAC